MTKRGANFKTIAGVTALGGMVTVGAWGVSATAQADNGGLPAKKPHPTSQATNTDPTKGSTNTGTPQVLAPKVVIATPTPSKAPAVTTTAAPTFPTFPPIIPSTINLSTTFPTIPPLIPSTVSLLPKGSSFPTIPPLIPSTFQLPVFWFF